ncbi:MAG TPA: hypothetical protein VGB99_01645 [Acidobacteriota bacterium]
MPQYQSSGAFSETELAVLRYADAITDTPVEVSDQLFSQLRAVFNDDQLVELTSALAWENYRARFDHALGIEAEGFSSGALCLLPRRAESDPGRPDPA